MHITLNINLPTGEAEIVTPAEAATSWQDDDRSELKAWVDEQAETIRNLEASAREQREALMAASKHNAELISKLNAAEETIKVHAIQARDAKESQAATLETAGRLDGHLTAIAGLVNFNGLPSALVDAVRDRLNELTASLAEATARANEISKAGVEAETEAADLRARLDNQTLEIKRLQDIVGNANAYPVRPGAAADDDAAEKAKRARRTKAEMEAARAAEAAPEPTPQEADPAAPAEVQEAGRAIAEWEAFPEPTLERGARVTVLMEDGSIREGELVRQFEGSVLWDVAVAGFGFVTADPSKLRGTATAAALV